MYIWSYLACSLAEVEAIHEDFVYKGDEEIGINKNIYLEKVALTTPTAKQFALLEAFFKNGYDDIKKLFEEGKSFDELLKIVVKYDSTIRFKKVYNEKTGSEITRGALESYLSYLKKISAVRTFTNPSKKTETVVEITYIGIAYVLHYILGTAKI